MSPFVLLLLLVASFASAVPVCVFDIDHTLTRAETASLGECGVNDFPAAVDGTLPAVFGQQALDECYTRGYGVAISTAEPEWIATRKVQFLKDLSSNRMDDAFFNSPAFQHGGILPVFSKQESLENIRKYYNVEPECLLFFDDSSMNGNTATNMGVTWQEASTSCNGWQLCLHACGLVEEEVSAGFDKLTARCTA
eukprot:gnl/Spiro4/11799_TR6235_c0_g1_i1.p1 gnl/Spiro4/11799_TR6235_c0_g1~~gnl/Spiro4/11799_TR6235_c0_g1_i1.p1  ORF type:complete len:195 (-),score=20.75 gnl/Spiro4/11799_TR6235_c0_g1_i1:65-649(-)